MINPIELFESLDKSLSPIESLRKAQREILDIYYKKLQETPRIGINLPTGSGKSLIAILLLEAWRKAGKVVAILTANNALARDMKKRCDELGIPNATIFGASGSREYKIRRMMNLMNYKQKKIIGIFNYYSFLYGTEYNQEIFPPDILVIDDASDFTTVRNQFFSIVINRRSHNEVYKKILETLLKETKLYPHLNSFLNNSARQNDVELIYFTHYDVIVSELEKELKNLRTDDNFRYPYDRNKGYLSSFLIFISQYDIEFRPLLIPEESLKMGKLKQIIFMSATLPKEELLNKMFGIRKSPVTIIDEKDITPEAYEEITTLGKRIIFPLENTNLIRGLGDKCKNIILDLVLIHKKLVVLVNSNHDAGALYKFLVAHGIETLYFTNENYENFAYQMLEGVLICANRYFGLDFPSDACKVEVIVRLPSVWNNVDAFQKSVLNNNSYVEQTIGYRLTQSLGRCNRLLDDEGLYYILDSRILSRLTGVEQYLGYLPRNMFAELMAGYLISGGGGIEEALRYGDESFFGIEDPMYSEIISNQMKEYKVSSEAEFISKYNIEIEGWEKSLSKSYNSAGLLFNLVADYYKESAPIVVKQNLELLAAFNYYLSAMNHYNAYKHYNTKEDRKSCLSSLSNAIKYGENSSWFNCLRAVYNEQTEGEKIPFKEDRIELLKIKNQIAENISNFLEANDTRKRNWRDTYKQLENDVIEGTHSQVIDSLIKFLRLIGYSARKGDNKKGEPDIIVTSNEYKLSIEVKTKEKGEMESVTSVTQAMGNKGVIERKSPHLKTYAILITQKEEFSQTAIKTAINQVKLIRASAVTLIMDKVYNQIDKMNSLTPVSKTSFVTSLISPYEFEELFVPSDSVILSLKDLEKINY